MFLQVSHGNFLSTLITLDLPLRTCISMLINLRHFVSDTAFILAVHLLQANKLLGKLVEHDIDIRTPT